MLFWRSWVTLPRKEDAERITFMTLNDALLWLTIAPFILLAMGYGLVLWTEHENRVDLEKRNSKLK